jgi:hypothetical protein
MRRAFTVALAAVLLVTIAAAQRRMLPNSYIKSPTPTVDALIKHVQRHPEVMDRYVRHFQMTPDEVMRFLRTLRLGRLQHDAYFDVWNVPGETGELRVRHLLFRKGEPFFFDQNGAPVMVVICGNPVIRSDEAAAPRLAPAVGGLMGPAEVTIPTPAVTEMPLNIVQPPAPIAPEVITEPMPEPEPSNPISAAPLALLPTLLIGINSGGGGVIPEPGTIAILGAGCAMLIARKAKKRSR